MALCSCGGACDFYPRSPCGERRHHVWSGSQQPNDFYPRSPCGERRYWPCVYVVGRSISIHALLAESDPATSRRKTTDMNFYPRSPCGERPEAIKPSQVRPMISIHALLAESDSNERGKGGNDSNFYPRSPCGERLIGNVVAGLRTLFLSTLSLRRATYVLA